MSVQLGENGCHHHHLCTNEWLVQKQQIGERGSMEQQQQQQQQQQQWAVLKCPRCESSNTKFCYYNNYSLSQPRHFCKACKRYWTRGGTLRNVPVGGGCRRKNKRAKRPSIDGASSSASSSLSVATNPHPPAQPQIMDMPSSSTYSPLFYGMPANPSEMNNLRFPPPTRFSLTPVSTVDTLGGAPPFSSGFGSGKQIIFQGADATSNSVLSSYNSIFGPSSGSASSPTMASLLLNGSGTLKQPHQETSHFQTLPAFQNQLQMQQQGNGEAMKMKVEGGQNRLQAWNNVPYQITNDLDQVGLPDPSVYWNSTTVNNAWHDPANVGSSSVPSLI